MDVPILMMRVISRIAYTHLLFLPGKSHLVQHFEFTKWVQNRPFDLWRPPSDAEFRARSHESKQIQKSSQDFHLDWLEVLQWDGRTALRRQTVEIDSSNSFPYSGVRRA